MESISKYAGDESVQHTGGGETSQQKNAHAAPESAEPLYDLVELNAISRGNPDFLGKILLMFCEQTPPMLQELSDAYYGGDFEKMALVAHKLKPSLENLRVKSLKNAIRVIEDSGRKGAVTPDLPELIDQTINVITGVINDMKAKHLNK